MPHRLRVVIAAAMTSCVVASACGGSTPTAPGGSGTTDGTAITGSEKLGWSQPAASLVEASSFSYAVYVDNAGRVGLTPSTCQQGSASAVYDCSATLPKLTVGQHRLEVVAANSQGLEGPRSAALTVTVK